MNQEILAPERPIAVYDPFRAQLTELREINKATIFDYEDPKGNKDARSHIYKLRQTKSAVDTARKDEKATSLAYGRRVDGEAKEIIEEIEGMIEVHARPISEIEQREEERKEKHLNHIGGIIAAGDRAAAMPIVLPLEDLHDSLRTIENVPNGENHWQEFAEHAMEVKANALAKIHAAIEARTEHDREQVELAELRAEKEQRDREEANAAREIAEHRIAAEAAAKATKEAERKAEEEKKAAADVAERRELILKLDAEKAQREAREAEERARERLEDEAKAEAAAAAKREADRKHRAAIDNESIRALVKGQIEPSAAKLAVALIAKGAVPNINIRY